MKLDVKFDSNLAAMKKVIKLGGTKSMSRAINDALAKGKTQLKNSVVDIYNLNKKSDFVQNAKVVKCYPGDLRKGAIVVSSRRFTSVHFPFSPKKYISQKATKDKKGRKKEAKKYTASITVKKNTEAKLPHAFVVNPDAPKLKGKPPVMLWTRYGAKKHGKQKIAPVKSLSVAQMVENEHVYNEAVQLMEKTYEERLVHHLNRQFKAEE